MEFGVKTAATITAPATTSAATGLIVATNFESSARINRAIWRSCENSSAMPHLRSTQGAPERQISSNDKLLTMFFAC
jgi:hypothetical protein